MSLDFDIFYYFINNDTITNRHFVCIKNFTENSIKNKKFYYHDFIFIKKIKFIYFKIYFIFLSCY